MRTSSNNRPRPPWMRIVRPVRIVVCAVVAFAVVNRTAVFAQGPMLQLDQLSKLADKATEVVDVAVDEAMLKQSSSLLAAKNPAMAEMMAGLKGVYVKSFEFDEDGAYTQADVDAVIAQLKAPWSRMFSVREKGERTEVYVYRQGDTTGGLALIAAEGKELTIVNLVGPVNLQSLSSLHGIMGIPGSVLGATAAVQKSSAKAVAKDGKSKDKK